MPVKEYLEAEETSLIEDAAQCLRDKLLIRLLRRLAGRITEVLGIEERHIDFTRRHVRIEHEKARISLFCPYCPPTGDKKTRLSKKSVFCPKCGKMVEKAVSKAKEERHLRKIPVDQDTLKLIREYIKKGGITEVNGKRMLFTICRQRAWQIIVECSERAGFFELENPENERKHHVHPHSFRDAFVINAIQKRPSFDDVRILQEILGHQNISTTARYRKLKGEEVQEYYDDVIKGEK